MASRISRLKRLCLMYTSWKVSGANFKWATGGEGETPRAVSPESPSLGPCGAPRTRVSLQKSTLMGFGRTQAEGTPGRSAERAAGSGGAPLASKAF